MIDDSGPEADGIKLTKEGAVPPMLEESLTLGGGPRFKRKKSFWRAFRRGEVWAITSYYLYDQINKYYFKVFADKNCPDNCVYFVRGE